jgi:hypothetical protein
MKKKTKLPSKRSLGGLRRVWRTSDNAPDYLGTMHIQRFTLLSLVKKLNETAADEVICNLAGWDNSNANGPFITVEVSPRDVPKKPQTPAVKKKTATLHAFF